MRISNLEKKKGESNKVNNRQPVHQAPESGMGPNKYPVTISPDGWIIVYQIIQWDQHTKQIYKNLLKSWIIQLNLHNWAVMFSFYRKNENWEKLTHVDGAWSVQ